MNDKYNEYIINTISQQHPNVAALIKQETERQGNVVELIASENFPSESVLSAVGSCLTAKYAEGYPSKRFYGGCSAVDGLETYCQQKWREVFNTDYHVNVQPHSGTNANLAAYMAVLQPCDKVLSMSLESGGHLSHGMYLNASGKIYDFIHYGVRADGWIDYVDFGQKLNLYKPKMVVIGASAYSRQIDYDAFHRILEEYRHITGKQCYMMVDMAHVAGLIAAGLHPSPFGYADIITTTTHKTLRGARGGLIFCKPELAKKIDSAVFPGIQGGPLMHIIAGKAVTAEEALTPEFKEYQRQVLANAKVMAAEFVKMGYEVVTGGTDTHLFLIDLTHTHPHLTGKMVQDELDRHGITLNKNTVLGETRNPMQASGLRIGTPAQTTRGWKEQDFIDCAHKIDEIIKEM